MKKLFLLLLTIKMDGIVCSSELFYTYKLLNNEENDSERNLWSILQPKWKKNFRNEPFKKKSNGAKLSFKNWQNNSVITAIKRFLKVTKQFLIPGNCKYYISKDSVFRKIYFLSQKKHHCDEWCFEKILQTLELAKQTPKNSLLISESNEWVKTFNDLHCELVEKLEIDNNKNWRNNSTEIIANPEFSTNNTYVIDEEATYFNGWANNWYLETPEYRLNIPFDKMKAKALGDVARVYTNRFIQVVDDGTEEQFAEISYQIDVMRARILLETNYTIDWTYNNNNWTYKVTQDKTHHYQNLQYALEQLWWSAKENEKNPVCLEVIGNLTQKIENLISQQ